MTNYMVGLFNSAEDAKQAVSMLKENGFDEAAISFMLPKQSEKEPITPAASADENESQVLGASAGMGIGFGAGIAASLASLTIPGLGPFLSAGILITLFTAAGAAVGGVAVALTKLGISEEDAHVYAEGIKRGGALVAVEVDEASSQKAKNIMQQANATDIDGLRERWQQDGWSHFDETVEPGERYPAF